MHESLESGLSADKAKGKKLGKSPRSVDGRRHSKYWSGAL